jgi:hypothetical protein
VAFIVRTSAGSWRPNWRDPAGRQRAKTFKRKRDAKRFVAELEAAKNHVLYIDPHAGKVKFADYLPRWVVGRNHEANTTFRDQGIMRNGLFRVRRKLRVRGNLDVRLGRLLGEGHAYRLRTDG